MTRKPRRQYTEEFKRETVALIQNSGKRQAPISRELGISDNTLSRWLPKYGHDSPHDGGPTVSPADFPALRAALRRVPAARAL
ncbi:MAG TPA: hypothetical protein DCG78_07670, partial [Anaerolineaceae bacterium]|nr:hypothetical protein [Anaerolineaceae bacterium]